MNTIVLLLFLMAQGAGNPRPSLIWENFDAPEYPRTAQIAHIAGAVTIEFTIHSDGAIVIERSIGHWLLIPAAEQTIRTSKIRCGECENGTGRFSVVFDFSIASHDCSESGTDPPYTAKLDSTTHISIIGEPICIRDPAVTITTVHRRSWQCLYLWKCKTIWLQ
jgi:Gram-negative bacterial TonB protein C-terminal